MVRGRLDGQGTREVDVSVPHGDHSHDYVAELERVDGLISAELGNDAQLNPEERKQLENIKSRQVTIR